ncbi:MAG: helix-turn-helix transcriptional regulator [Planctomycetes bacterium]|nr:helix-turn-helix transcriptional regulator [Planctomycetota bacterium]
MQSKQPLPEDELEMLIRVADRLSVMGHPTRLMIIGLLKRHQEATVSEIAEKLTLSLASASQHLKTMERVGLLKYRRSGRQSIYSVRLQMVTEICDVICHQLDNETINDTVDHATFERLMNHLQG